HEENVAQLSLAERQPLVESLTERELDVLRLLKTSLSATEIAGVGFADVISIGALSIAVLLILAIREVASPMTAIIVIAIVCGIGLATGALQAEAATIQSRREGKSPTDCRGTRA
ncbi:MAG: hypothetical protein U9R25_05480, partial [Chloroflexota bacterium]|nr:hypothetical protein [Chloroflexota bacterium]